EVLKKGQLAIDVRELLAIGFNRGNSFGEARFLDERLRVAQSKGTEEQASGERGPLRDFGSRGRSPSQPSSPSQGFFTRTFERKEQGRIAAVLFAGFLEAEDGGRTSLTSRSA